MIFVWSSEWPAGQARSGGCGLRAKGMLGFKGPSYPLVSHVASGQISAKSSRGRVIGAMRGIIAPA